MLKSLMNDIRFGLRMLTKNPGFTAVVVLTLALGIGANTMVFTIVNAVLFRGLPFEDADRIVAITSNNLAKNQEQIGVSYLDFLDWKAQSKSFKGLAAAQMGSVNMSDPGLPAEQHWSGRISVNTFSLMGQKPLLGRDFLPEEDQGGGAQVAILGYSLWQNRYGGDPNILGKVIRLNEQDFTVVGVMPEGMEFPYNQELWYPLFASGPASSLLKRDLSCCFAYGRLADGATLADAQAEMNVIASRLQKEYPNSNEGRGIRVMPYTSFFGGQTIRMLFLAMLGAVGFVLLIACANVANLLLSRSLTRAREVSIRAALGASRGRVVRQLLTESVLLGLLGGAAGLLFSIWGVRAFTVVLPEWMPYWIDFSMDYAVFAYLAAICIATSILFGLAPALHISKVDLNRTLKEGARGSGGGRSRFLSRALVVTEVSLALVLLVGAGLMVRSFLKMQGMSAAFENEKILTMWIYFTGGRYLTPEPRLSFLERLEPELNRIPGAKVALSSMLPLQGGFSWQFEVEGRPIPQAKDRPTALGLEISPPYFEVLGIPLLRGRTFMPDEGREGKSVVIVNQRFASKYWPGEDPIGKRIKMVRETEDLRIGAIEQPMLTVVGLVPDVKQDWDVQAELKPLMYVPYRQGQQARGIAIIARTQSDASSLVVPLRKAVQSVNDAMPVIDVMTLPETFARMRWFQRTFSSLFAIFAAIGVALAAVGIYAVMAYSVSQRTQEIGIRMAFGAHQKGILEMVISQGLKLAAIGVAIGLVGAFAVTRVMARLLIGITPTDPATFVTVALLLTGVTVLACFLPARRAARVDPMLALRTE